MLKGEVQPRQGKTWHLPVSPITLNFIGELRSFWCFSRFKVSLKSILFESNKNTDGGFDSLACLRLRFFTDIITGFLFGGQILLRKSTCHQYY